MGAHDGNDGIRELDAIQNFRSDDRMDFHFLELFGREAPRLGENVLGNRELANVVQHGGRTNGIQLGVVHAEVLGNLDRINLDATEMIMGGVVLRFNRQRKGLDVRK